VSLKVFGCGTGDDQEGNGFDGVGDGVMFFGGPPARGEIGVAAEKVFGV
jgi:hypothetical protein